MSLNNAQPAISRTTRFSVCALAGVAGGLAVAILAAGLVSPAFADDHGAHSTAEAKTGISVSSPWVRATPPGAKVGAGYVKLGNSSGASDRLVGAAAPDIAGRVEIHEMSMDNGVMKMRELPNGLEIGSKSDVQLKPGGFHLMLMDLKRPIEKGEDVKMSLTFEKAGKMDVVFKAYGVGSMGPDGDKAGHKGHGGDGGGHDHGDHSHHDMKK